MSDTETDDADVRQQIDPRECPNRDRHKDEACGTCGLIMDYPTAFAFVGGSDPEDHHDRCSYRAAMLCDCDLLNNEYARRKAALTPELGEQRP